MVLRKENKSLWLKKKESWSLSKKKKKVERKQLVLWSILSKKLKDYRMGENIICNSHIWYETWKEYI